MQLKEHFQFPKGSDNMRDIFKFLECVDDDNKNDHELHDGGDNIM